MEDQYVLYVFGAGIDSDYFWNQPIQNVERMYKSATAFKAWSNNPKMK